VPIFEVLKIFQATIKAMDGCPRNGRDNRKWISGGVIRNGGKDITRRGYHIPILKKLITDITLSIKCWGLNANIFQKVAVDSKLEFFYPILTSI
jgi:hypothetical protein